MESPRKSGVLLLLGAGLVLVAIQYGYLSESLFPVGLALFPLGLWLFLLGGRDAERAEKRTTHPANPSMRSATAEAFAAQQAVGLMQRGNVSDQLHTPARSDAAQVDAGLPDIGIELSEESGEEGGGEDWLSSDVSFPEDAEERGRIADEIRNLQRLLDDGVIDRQEFAAAKAKLLR